MRPVDPRVLPHVRVARRPLLVVTLGSALAALLVIAQAFAVAALVVALVDETGWQQPAEVLLVVVAARAAVAVGVDRAATHAAAAVGRELRRTVLRAAGRLGATDLAQHRIGSLAVLATRGVAAVEPYLTRYLPALLLAAVLPLLTVVAIAAQDWLAALVVVLTLPLVPVFAALIGMSTRDKVARQWRLLDQLSGHFVDVVRGLPTLVAHRRARSQSQQIAAVTDRCRRGNRDVLRLAFASSAALELVATLSVALVAVLVGLRLAAGGLDLETALVVLLLAPEAYWPLRKVGAEFHAAAEGTATFEAIHELLATPAARASLAYGETVHLRDVEVTWPGRDRPALGPLSVDLPRHGLVVVTGASGSGKSTLLAALLGEVATSAGEVQVAAPDLEAWRGSVAYVGQQPWLMDGSVRDNVRVGRPAADDHDVAQALSSVGLDLSPDHVLGEDGRGLSAGQRARLALARVVVSHRPMVLLDEPTAHLDAATEQTILAVVRELAAARCVVVVAHRDVVVAAADLVVRLPEPVAPAPTPLPVPGDRSSPGVVRTDPPVAVAPDPQPSRAAARHGLVLASALGVAAATSGVALTATAGWLIVRASEHPPVLMLMVAIVAVRTFGLARPVLRYAERLVAHDVALRALATRRTEVYDALVPLVPGRLGRRRGDLLASVVDDVDAQLDDLVRVRLPALTWCGTSLVTAALVAVVHPVAALVVALTALVGGAGAWTWGLLGSRRHGARRIAARATLSARVLVLLQDQRPLALWQADERARRRVDEAGAALDEATGGTARWLAPARAWSLLLGAVGTVTVAGVAHGEVSGPVLALLVLVPLALSEVATPLADAGALRHETREADRRISSLTSLEPAVTDPPRPRKATSSVADLTSVTAAWGRATALEPVSLAIGPGRSVGIVGPSGCGKSTLAALLVRFLAPRSGSYVLGDQSVDDLAADDVRRRIGLLDDDPYLFSTTLVENVRLARPSATDAEVEQALRSAHLGAWMDALPGGLHTPLGEGAAAVSGGERARIGLARLLLAEHEVLVLDEPTAHLDRATARQVTAELLALTGDTHGPGGPGLVWITHERDGLDRMDEVLALA